MRFVRAVLYFEAFVVNLLTGLICFFIPGWFVSNFVPQPVPALALEMTRWYGVLLFVFAYVMVRALRADHPFTITILVEGFLLGDIVHLVASVLYVIAGGLFNMPVFIMFGMSIFLACVRTYYLVNYYRGEKTFSARA